MEVLTRTGTLQFPIPNHPTQAKITVRTHRIDLIDPTTRTGSSGSSTGGQVGQVGTQGNSFGSSQNNSQNRSWNNTQPYSDQGRRYVNKYQHRRDQPRNFKFEYGDSQKYGIINNLKEIITYIQTNGKPFVRHRRYNGEINEADIPEMSMEDVCLPYTGKKRTRSTKPLS